MKKNRIYIIWIIILTVLIGFSIYNYNHPIPRKDIVISTGKVIGFNEEYSYNENSEYIPSYTMELESKNNGNITINLTKDEINKYKVGDKLNYYEEKGEYIITTEKANDYNTNVIWIILPIVELGGIIVFIIKIIKNRNK